FVLVDARRSQATSLRIADKCFSRFIDGDSAHILTTTLLTFTNYFCCSRPTARLQRLAKVLALDGALGPARAVAAAIASFLVRALRRVTFVYDEHYLGFERTFFTRSI